jgi:hypothetical protein
MYLLRACSVTWVCVCEGVERVVGNVEFEGKSRRDA